MDRDLVLAWIVGISVLAFGVAILFSAVSAVIAEHSAFMAACTADRPEYECTAMWRGGRL